MDALGRNIEGAMLVVRELDQAVKSDTGRSLLKASTAAINDYPGYTAGLRKFGDEITARVATAPAPSIEAADDFDIQEGTEDDMSNTILTSSDNLFNQITEDKLDQTFVIGGEAGAHTLVEAPRSLVEAPVQSQIDNLTLSGIDKVANGTPIEETIEATKEPEQITKVEENVKKLVFKKGDKAAYIDTVILCLIAQLSIFGLLIIVLLIIK